MEWKVFMRKLGLVIIFAVLGFFGSAIFLGVDKTEKAEQHMMKYNNSMPMHERKEMMMKDKDEECGAGISKDDAINIATESSGLDLSTIYNLNVKAKDYYDLDIYDVEFMADNKEYNYNIDRKTGEIVAMDYEVDKKYFSHLTGKPITEEDARNLIADKVSGVSAKSIQLVSDHEDNYEQFEGKFMHDNIEYEFKINKDTGVIVEWKWKNHGDKK